MASAKKLSKSKEEKQDIDNDDERTRRIREVVRKKRAGLLTKEEEDLFIKEDARIRLEEKDRKLLEEKDRKRLEAAKKFSTSKEEKEHIDNDDGVPNVSNWKSISKVHREKFEKLVKYIEENHEKVEKINAARVCFTNEFRIGFGCDGTSVYIGLSDDGYERAVKRLVKHNSSEFGLHEQEMLHAIVSEYIVRYWFYDDTTNDEFVYLILGLCEETLHDYIDKQSLNVLTTNAPIIMHHILQGLGHLHGQGEPILHRDIKPSNIMRDVNGNWLLADFGISRKLTEGQTSLISQERGTKFFKAVESHSAANINAGVAGAAKARYKTHSDIQVAGMVFFYLLTKGYHAFGPERDNLGNLLDDKPDLDKLADIVAKDLISWMLKYNPNDRPHVDEALKHPYLLPPKQQFELLACVGNEPEIKKKGARCDVVDKINKDSLLPKDGWKSQIPPNVLAYLCSDGNYPISYGDEWCQCLRLIRNKSQHWNDLPRPRPQVRDEIGEPQVYFLKVFPNLPLVIHRVIRNNMVWKTRPNLEKFF